MIIYDRLTSRLSTRLFWTFKYFGHDNVQILDGGFGRWQAESFAISTEVPYVPQVAESTYTIKRVREELVADIRFVQSRFEKSNTRLIDGRPAKQFSGEEFGRVFHTHQMLPRTGHIPTAANVLWRSNFNADGTFKSPEDLRRLYLDANVGPGNDVITYCNEGLHAAPPWFVLTQLLDFQSVRLYDSSMAEWAKSDNRMSTTDADE